MNEAYELICELAQIPSPSNHEEKRAEFCKKWLLDNGAENVYIDEALNVIYPVGDVDGELVVIMAHSDVVFPDTDPLPLRVENGRIYCPGVGDDTSHVVGMLMAIKEMIKNGKKPKEGGVIFVVNSGEEGLGNLKGCREIMRKFGGRVKEFITFDSNVRSIHSKTVGSRRFKVEIKTEGGHSYQAFGNKNAIACMATLIHKLYEIKVPPIGKTTYNVGLISGGTSVNTIAQSSEALIEFRSDERAAIDIMQSEFDRVIGEAEGEVKVTLIGDRPCAGDVDQDRQRALNERMAAAVKRHFGFDVANTPGSTDCNIPSAMGIPAVCVGLFETKGAHTRDEYVEIDSIEPGVALAKDIVGYYFE